MVSEKVDDSATDGDGEVPRPRYKIMLVTSPGGHLTQLVRLREWWEHHERVWVCSDTLQTASMLENEDVIHGHFPTTRNLPNLLRNLVLAVTVLRREKPDVIISTGAGIAVPFLYVARLLRIRTVFLEVFDRVDSATMTGRLCHPVVDLFLLQWPEQQPFYRRGVVVGTLW